MTLGDRLKAARMAAELTQADVADRLGVASVCVSNWELGKRQPAPDDLGEIASALALPSPIFLMEDPQEIFKHLLEYQALHPFATTPDRDPARARKRIRRSGSGTNIPISRIWGSLTFKRHLSSVA